jgi:histidinol-phosphatase
VTSSRDLEADLGLARALADRADRLTLSRFRAPDLRTELKADETEVTDADRAVERALRERLAAERPGDSILGEEYGGNGTDGWQWVLDPIDGTANYLRGIPVWATLIGLVHDGVPRLGVVSAPALGRRWEGIVGSGARALWAGGERPIHVSTRTRLSEATVSVGALEYWRETGTIAPALRLLERSARDRTLGDFWPYLLVAEGAMDIACEPGLKPYDMAAPCAVVRAAGGTFTDLSGTGSIWGGSALATNGLLHAEAARILEDS